VLFSNRGVSLAVFPYPLFMLSKSLKDNTYFTYLFYGFYVEGCLLALVVKHVARMCLFHFNGWAAPLFLFGVREYRIRTDLNDCE